MDNSINDLSEDKVKDLMLIFSSIVQVKDRKYKWCFMGSDKHDRKKLLSDSDVSIIPADGMKDAEKKAVNATINKG